MEITTINNKVTEFHHYIMNLWSEGKPLQKIFRTENRGYLYDTGTNRVLACSDAEFALIQNITSMNIREGIEKTRESYPTEEFLQALKGVQAAVEEKNIMKTNKAAQFGLSAHFSNLDELINKSLQQLILEVTEKCNLRCGYCIYNPAFSQQRNHGIQDMSLDIGLRAIDYLYRHSQYQENIAVAFYGGEPLLRFPFIQTCVDHTKQIFSKKQIHFTMTTNATLITPVMAEYFAKEKFGMHVSLDGPEDIHDQNRKDKQGIGSFRKTISGIRMLIDAYGDQKLKISLSMVYAPPYSKEKITRISQLWDDLSWLPKDMSVSITYAESSYRPIGITGKKIIDTSLFDWAKKDFIDNYKKRSKAHPIVSQSIEAKMANLVQRAVLPVPREKYHLNGCCLPAVRKIYVTADGTLLLCERVGNAPKIGNIFTGIDHESIINIYVKEYGKESLPNCSECWALQLCEVCYAHAFFEGRFNIDRKNDILTVL